MTLAIVRGSQTLSIVVTPKQGVVSTDPSRYALGLSIAPIGIVPLSFMQSVKEGAQLTWAVTKETAVGLWQFFYGIFTLHANLSEVSGPVGIAGAVGTAAQTGFGDLLSIAALISINLALIKPSIANAINSISFALLVLLMVVVTGHDIYKLVI
jgi:regulator of sigma E protease